MVSVIVPTYNYGSYIAETLNSILQQSYTDFECLIIDDGSTDDTSSRVIPFLSDKRFTYIQQANSGVSVSRNNGLKKAQGEYVLFLDADDRIEEHKLQASVDFLDANADTDLVYSGMRYFKSEDPSQFYYSFSCNKNNDAPWMKNFSGNGSKLVSVLLEGNIMVISSPVFRRSVINEIGVFDETIRHNEDWDLWLRMALANKTMQYLDAPETKAMIRVHKSSASVNVFYMQVGGLLVLLKNASAIRSFGLESILKKRITDHKKAIADTLIRTPKAELNARLAYLKQMCVYDIIFSYEAKTLSLARLYLRIFKATL